MAEGTLIVNAKKQIRVKFVNSKSKEVEMAVPDAELSSKLKQEPVEKLNGRKVELDEEQGQPKRVRPVGEPFTAAAAQPLQQPAPQRGQQGRVPQGQRQTQQRPAAVRGAFHNPYNFVPALPRDRVTGELGDHAPIGHHVLHPDRFTGFVRVKMAVITPLLLPDAANAVDVGNDHKSFPVRVDAEGKPYIPPTSIKGMLRSAYEAVTNSRLAVFAGHQAKLQYRVWDKRTRSAPKRDYAVSPRELLSTTLLPAYWIDRLSPADRVFGWVNQQGHGAYKGNVRIGPVTCITPREQAIENFGTPGLPLAILGQPKPQQARFYVAASQNGDAQRNGLSKEEAGYFPGKGLRGRKVYPHQKGLPEGHWDNARQDRTQQAVKGHFQEYRRPRLNGQEQRDNQNRSIQGWVKPGTEFTFDIHVTNLSKVELGALLWLLSLPDNHYHRFGGGKPLGFGSVRLEIDAANTHLHVGESWRELYSTLEEIALAPANIAAAVEAFRQAVVKTYGNGRPFEQVPFIAAWLRADFGHPDGSPTHYPRITTHPDPAGENFRWFTGNESGQRVCLGNLTHDPGLPLPNPGQGGS